MGNGQIYTKLHEALRVTGSARAKGKENYTTVQVDEARLKEARRLLEIIMDHPFYVLDAQLFDRLDHDAMVASITAMRQAGVLHIPFPIMGFELWAGEKETRIFGLVHERGVNDFQIAMLPMFKHGPFDALAAVLVMEMSWETAIPEGMEVITLAGRNPNVEGAGWSVSYSRKEDGEPYAAYIANIGAGMMVLTMMTRLHGIATEHVSAGKLNKHRVASGKPPIPDHHIVRIGHVLDAHGNRVQLHEGNRRSMPIHMRAGHTRRQPHGARWLAENPTAQIGVAGVEHDHHLIFVEPVLVNYRDGTDLAKPLPKLVKF